MSSDDDNFWKQVKSFKGCGQKEGVTRWGGQKVLMLILAALIVGTLLAKALTSLF
jgi:hypothetical protein